MLAAAQENLTPKHIGRGANETLERLKATWTTFGVVSALLMVSVNANGTSSRAKEDPPLPYKKIIHWTSSTIGDAKLSNLAQNLCASPISIRDDALIKHAFLHSSGPAWLV